MNGTHGHMRIFLFCGSDYGVGTFVRAREFARSFRRQGHFVVLGYLGGDYFRTEKRDDQGFLEIGFPRFLNRLNFDHFASPLAIYAAKKLAEEMNFDVVHGFEHYAVVHHACEHARNVSKAIYISDWADWVSTASKRRFYSLPGGRKYIKWLERRAKLSADGVTAISRNLYDEAVAMGISGNQVIYLPGGAPVDRLQPLDIKSCKERFGFANESVIFGYMGSWLTEELIPFIDAFARLPEVPSKKMLVMGNSSQQLRDYVFSTGLEEQVVITGFIDESEINQYLCACDALLIPMIDNLYNRSRWPNKIGDYMACGRPVIASNVGEIPSVFSMANIGYLVDGTTESVYSAMMDVALSGAEKQQALGSNARRNAEENFSWDALSHRLLAFYRTLLEKR